MKKAPIPFLTAVLFLVGFASLSFAQTFPTKDLSGVIMWGAGGATDNVARALTPHVENALGKQIVLQNKPGATGAVATQWVHSQPADGYTLLYGAENPQLYRVLDITQLEYKDFYPIQITARGVGLIACNVIAPWKTLKDLFDDAKKNPGNIKMGSTGPGGLPHVVGSMIKATQGLTFNAIPFGGEGPGMTTRLACVDGPEFDGHRVNYDLRLQRLQAFREEDNEAMIRLEKEEMARCPMKKEMERE